MPGPRKGPFLSAFRGWVPLGGSLGRGPKAPGAGGAWAGLLCLPDAAQRPPALLDVSFVICWHSGPMVGDLPVTQEAVSAPGCLQAEVSGIQQELCRRPRVPSHLGHRSDSIQLWVQVFPQGESLVSCSPWPSSCGESWLLGLHNLKE